MLDTRRLAALALLALFAPRAPAAAPFVPRPTFERQVHPILARHCLRCHGEKRRGGLDLRSRASALRGGGSGPAVVAGSASRSPLFEAVHNGTMPPGKAAKLTADELAVLRVWLDSGAAGSGGPSGPFVTARDRAFWAFRPLHRPTVPAVRGRALSPVDAFLLARLEPLGLGFAPEADRLTFLRRVSFDLTGLPPTPEEQRDFLADDRPGAHERLIDRLLASPAFGERWGRHWLDAAGYVDVQGVDNDAATVKLAENKWLYRDWVVRALNADLPLGQFLTEQLAGDELVDWRSASHYTPRTRDLLIATGFLRSAADDTDENELNTLDIRHGVLQRTGEVLAVNLLGLTMGCAKCHDHKFEPIAQRDYYAFLAALTPAFGPDRWLQPRQRALPDLAPAEKRALDEHNARVEKQLAALKAMKAGPKAIADMASRKRGYGHWQVVYDTGPPLSTRLLRRGDPFAPGEEVAPGLFAVLAPTDEQALLKAIPPNPHTSGRRLALARRLTDWRSPAGALVARVRVNRVWQQVFGHGLVSPSDNFGLSGARPTHPELLEWLADEHARTGGSLKALLRLLMTSAAYRQASAVPAGPGDRLDPDNRLLWRMQLRRLESEAVRDSLLAISGELDRSPGGPPERGEAPRRSLYRLARRNYHPPLVTAFDQPVVATNCTCRTASAVVSQSLALLNDPFVLARAEAFAARVGREGDPVEAAFRLALGRPPRGEERAWSADLLERHAARFRAQGRPPAQARAEALTRLCHMLFNASELLYVP